MQTAQQFASKIIDSPSYQKSLRDRVKAGTLDPRVEEFLWSIGHSAISRRRRIDRDLRCTVAELVRRLAVALRSGDLQSARVIWEEGKLAEEIQLTLR